MKKASLLLQTALFESPPFWDRVGNPGRTKWQVAGNLFCLLAAAEKN
jgi:hypothetical protein